MKYAMKTLTADYVAAITAIVVTAVAPCNTCQYITASSVA